MAGQKFKVAVDWVTLMTWDFYTYVNIAAITRGEFNEWREAKVMQYEGFSNGSIFYGHALQGKRQSYMFRSSGATSQEFINIILDARNIDPFKLYSTRIDLQRTIPAPTRWHPHTLYTWIALQFPEATTSIIQSETGSTVYLGSRLSGRFARLYEKNYESLYVRLEIELKRDYSRQLWDDLANTGCKVLPEYYAVHLQRLPVPQWVIQEWGPDVQTDVDIRPYEKKFDEDKQLAWLKSLIPKFQEMANSHSIGERVRDIFYSLSITQGDYQDDSQ